MIAPSGNGSFPSRYALIATSLPRTAPILFRLPASWETEINLQSRYPGGIFVTKIGAAESSACKDAGVVNAAIPASIPTATSSKLVGFIVVPPSAILALQLGPINEPAESRDGRVFE